MPRQQAFSIENNFSKGLLTEHTALNFPENACTETFNCTFDNLGNVSRRLGFDYENANSVLGDNITGAILDRVFTAVEAKGYRVASLTQGL